MVINSSCLTDKKELAIPGQTTTGKEFLNSLIADSLPKTILPTKKLSSYLLPPAFTQWDVLWYALTGKNPTIYVSLIEQFWQTATIETVNDGEQHITVTVYEQTIAITEASIRRHIQLADVDGISSLPNTEIFVQLTLMSKKLYELTELCTKLFEKVTSLEKDLKQTKKVYGKALTKLVKKVKHLEAKLKSTSVRRKARMVISNDEEDLVLEDPSKQGRMIKTEYEDVETEYEEVEYELDQTDTFQQITPTKVSQAEDKVKRVLKKRRSTVSSRDSTVGGLLKTAEEILSTDERIAQKLNEEEMAKAAAREEQERIDFKKSLRVTKSVR
ncbi:hypothetical protein Tco_0446154 [Tanacetum coccineum]